MHDVVHPDCFVVLGSQTISNPQAISITASITNVPCNGASTGAIDITASGGTGTLTYDWGAQGNSKDLANLAAGTYTVTVTDGNHCSNSASFTVTQPLLALTRLATKNRHKLFCQ